jgi:hypothetical protein
VTQTGGSEMITEDGAFSGVAAHEHAANGAPCPRARLACLELFCGVEKSWAAAGRTGRPRLVAQVYVALGPEAALADPAA